MELSTTRTSTWDCKHCVYFGISKLEQRDRDLNEILDKKNKRKKTWAALFAIGYTADCAYTSEGQDPGPDWTTTSVDKDSISAGLQGNQKHNKNLV